MVLILGSILTCCVAKLSLVVIDLGGFGKNMGTRMELCGKIKMEGLKYGQNIILLCGKMLGFGAVDGTKNRYFANLTVQNAFSSTKVSKVWL